MRGRLSKGIGARRGRGALLFPGMVPGMTMPAAGKARESGWVWKRGKEEERGGAAPSVLSIAGFPQSQAGRAFSESAS
jgi:hypothetical protein